MKSKDTITALEITEKYLKVAQSAWIKNKRELVTLEAKALSLGIDDKAISIHIVNLFKAKFIKKNQRIILCLPGYLATTRYLKVPSREPEEIRNIINLQSSKYLPYPCEELILGYSLVGQDAEGYSQVFLVIVHQDIINRYLKLLKDAGIMPDTILISSFGLYNWYVASQVNLKMTESFMLANIDYNYQEFEIISEGKLIFSRSLLAESKPKDPNQIALWQNKLIEEIKRSIIAYQKENSGKNPVEVVLSGSSKNLSGLDKRVSNALSLPAEILGSLENISLKEKSRWEDTDFSFSGIIGLVLGRTEESLNLLPKEMREKSSALTKKKEWLKALVLFISLLFTVFLWMGKNINDKARYLKQLQVEINKVSPEAKSLEEIKNQLEIVKERFSISASSIDVLSELYRITPSQITFTSFSFDENNQLAIKGQAEDLSDVFKFVHTLEESEYFQGVSVKNAVKRKLQLGEVADFEIVCPLSKRR